MADTTIFNEYQQCIECLSSWLTSTNVNIQEVLTSANKQQSSDSIEV